MKYAAARVWSKTTQKGNRVLHSSYAKYGRGVEDVYEFDTQEEAQAKVDKLTSEHGGSFFDESWFQVIEVQEADEEGKD